MVVGDVFHCEPQEVSVVGDEDMVGGGESRARRMGSRAFLEWRKLLGATGLLGLTPPSIGQGWQRSPEMVATIVRNTHEHSGSACDRKLRGKDSACSSALSSVREFNKHSLRVCLCLVQGTAPARGAMAPHAIQTMSRESSIVVEAPLGSCFDRKRQRDQVLQAPRQTNGSTTSPDRGSTP